MRSFGLLGGTFDPIHFGHLRLAVEMKERLGLSDGVRLVPAATPALRGTPSANAHIRSEMIDAAVADCSELSVDNRELSREGISFTVDTLESFRTEYPDAAICFIVGMDAFARLHHWHRWRDIVSLAHISVAKRPGSKFPDHPELGAFVAEHAVTEPERLVQSPAGHVCLMDIPPLDVSATYIRTLVSQGRSTRFLIPDRVREMIEHYGAYRDGQ